MSMNPGFASYLAAKKKARLAGTPAATPPMATPPVVPQANPMAVLPPQMVARIKKAPTGVLPPGLAKYMASKKKVKPKGK